VPGATQSPEVQTVPCGQSASAAHVWVHPLEVHSSPVEHPFVLVHVGDVGGDTVLQP
jgi:hypothetical protein